MDGHRRRHTHKHNWFRYLIPAISAISGAILLLYCFLSFLAPSPDHHLHHFGRRHSSFDHTAIDDDTPTVPSVFKVPTSGKMISDRNLWSTSMSKFYFGCSNASSQSSSSYTAQSILADCYQWSTFSEIFDVDWFISHLSRDVKIIRELPHKGGRKWSPYSTRVPRKCNERCYHIRVLPLFSKKRLSKFDYRLANKLETDFQKLRCRVNYHALKFTAPIIEMGQTLVNRMRNMGKHFVALHLRFEPDMLAFSGCYYGGGEKEIKELGRCPLTPEEVGLMLRALGYDKDVHIYVASGEVYGGNETLAPLRALFPNIHSKDTIATTQELEPFSPFSSRMAALDFMVCDQSDVFVTNNNGNMAKILAGRRVEAHQIGFMGEPNEVRPGRGEFHENPTSCICEQTDKTEPTARKINTGISEADEVVDPEMYEDDEDEDMVVSNLEYLFNGTNVDGVPEENELEELLSD
ncbi:GDP-fucose protein O-fucosyltransferase [Cynara cardunculus var. scolymus]|uniref:O-fucosyltransferase family protein n=1 Tax=Cynara cardunculus var. scolymus TaxID=59895 RepID=A0A118K4D7_CYNCS|nr:GDP-fucose protein O-fucosyltransferase [Cynara cardunculus var. scolymus]